MKRWPIYLLGGLLAVSLAANGALGWVLWRGQKEYTALSRLFVKAKQDLAKAEQQAKSASSPTAAAPPKTDAAPPKAEPTAVAAAKPAAAPAPTGTVEEVRQRFEPRFLAVQSDCEGQLNALLNEAKAEYQTAKAANANVDVAALGAKYLGRADKLRRGCDSRVEALLSEMGAALRAAGLPTDLVAEVRQAYEDRIVERQAEIMAKAPGS